MVSHWLNNGNIIQYIKNVGFVTDDVHRLVGLRMFQVLLLFLMTRLQLFEVALGLSYLHEHDVQIVHGDLRGVSWPTRPSTG